MTTKAAQQRLNDPDGHYPYKADEVRALLAEDPPAGPGGPDDDRARVSDFISEEIIDATEVYVEAQAAYVRDPGDAARADYQDAAAKLVEARRAHRARRAGLNIVAERAV